ncbi:MAG: LiaF transmembrane domain-containing protein [Alkalispirochaetaceae bacterium]
MFPRRTVSYPRRLLLFGSLLVVLGGVLLLWTNGLLPNFGALWPLLLLLAGIWQLDYSLVSDGREATVLTGMAFTLSGVFILLRTTALLNVEFHRIWPVFMTIAGVSLLAYSFTKERGHRAVLMVPSVAMITLSVIFLLFSLDIVQASFIHFVSRWWPMLLVFLGGIFLYRGVPQAIAGDEDPGEEEEEEI